MRSCAHCGDPFSIPIGRSGPRKHCYRCLPFGSKVADWKKLYPENAVVFRATRDQSVRPFSDKPGLAAARKMALIAACIDDIALEFEEESGCEAHPVIRTLAAQAREGATAIKITGLKHGPPKGPTSIVCSECGVVFIDNPRKLTCSPRCKEIRRYRLTPEDARSRKVRARTERRAKRRPTSA